MRNMTVKVRSSKDGDKPEEDNVEEVTIVADDGRPLFHIAMRDNGDLEVSSGMMAKLDGVIKDDRLRIEPVGGNSIRISRPDYE